MKTKTNFKALDFADIEFSNTKPSKEDQKEFSEFLAKRKKSKIRTAHIAVPR